MKRNRICWIALIVVLMTSPAHAQYGVFDMGALTNSLAQPTSPSANLAPNTGVTEKAPAAPVSEDVLTFTPSAKKRAENLAGFVREARERDRAGGDALQQLLAANDIIGEAERYLQAYGMSASNVADTMSLYLATAWHAVHGSLADPNSAQMRGLRNQLVAAIGATPTFLQTSDAEKQQLAEAMIVQSVMIGHFFVSVQNNPQEKRRVQQAVAETAMSLFGLDLAALEMTPQGLQ